MITDQIKLRSQKSNIYQFILIGSLLRLLHQFNDIQIQVNIDVYVASFILHKLARILLH